MAFPSMDTQRLILLGIRVGLVAVVAYVSAQAFWFFSAGPEPLPLSVEPAASATTDPVDVDALRAMNLFGEPATIEAAPANEVLQETRLSLVLVGVFVADEAEASSALIARSGQQPDLYSVGDQLPGGATLLEVHADRAVIRRAGLRELVRFAEPRSIAPAAFSRSPNQASSQAQPSEPTFREAIATYRAEIDENPTSALERLGVEPVMAGQPQGYTLGNQPAVLARTGLRAGDVVLSVNGRPVGNVNEDRLELDNVVAQGRARLEVKRGSRRFFVTVSL